MIHRIAFLSVIAAMGVISASLCSPALPMIAQAFSVDISSIQFVLSLFLVGNAVGQFLSGTLSDLLGQRMMLLSGLILYLIAGVVAGLSTSFGMLIFGRFLQGVGSAAGPVLARAIAASSFPLDRSAQVQSYGAFGMGVASMIAALSSGELSLTSWRSGFWLTSLFGLALFFWAFFVLKDPVSMPRSRVAIQDLFTRMKQVVSNKTFFSVSLCYSITYGLMYGYITLFPFLLESLTGVNDPLQVGIYSSYMIAFYMLGTFVTSRIVMRFGSGNLLWSGVVIQLAAGIFLFAAKTTYGILGALFLYNVSMGIILPLASAQALAPFVGVAVGTASSTLGLTYRLIGSIISMAVCQLPLLAGKSLAISIVVLSGLAIYVLRYTSSEQLSLPRSEVI